jgi:hypothetical protein
MKFPNIARSFERERRRYEAKEREMRWYEMEEGELKRSNEREEEMISSYNRNRFNQRQTIKGIIIKNFLSNRNKVEHNVEEQLSQDEKN